MDIEIFKNDEFGEIRTTTVDGEPWFIGKDAALALGYSNTRDAIYKHVDDEDKGVANCDTPSGIQSMIIINESGLYSLVMSSKLPTAKKFKRWVTSEVLPAIRKHGMYATDDLLNDPDLAIKTFQLLKEEREKRKVLEAQAEADKPKVIFSDAISASKTSILVGDLAKLLRQNGVDIGQKRLFEWFREHGYLIKQRGASWNMPTQRALESGFFEVKESTHMAGDGVTIVKRTPKVTGKGQVHFINKFLKENEEV